MSKDIKRSLTTIPNSKGDTEPSPVPHDLISQVHNVTYRLILEKRHLCFMTWEAIAIDLGYSVRWVQIRHTRALEVVQKLLDEGGATATS